MSDCTWLLDAIRAIHEEIRSLVVSTCEQCSEAQMSQIAEDGAGDTIYAIDRVSDTLLVKLVEERIASREPVILIAEGIVDGEIALPKGTRNEDAKWRILADPIDGTRCLMYQKRSGWILTGVAPNRHERATLADIELAVQTEIPVIKQHLCDTLWAHKGWGVKGERTNRLTGKRMLLTPRPSRATSLAHGFATVSRFFSGGRDLLAAIDDDIHFTLLGPGSVGKARCFEDQYISTGGQLYELMMGHDRFVADLRPLLEPTLKFRGWAPGLCCHPYDLCTELIAREAGVLITDATGQPLNAGLNIHDDVSWIGYANKRIQALVEPELQLAMRQYGLLPA
jgi:fructose-1,6-bisphosphatase/inositol monophosphatase family enzyme